MGEFRYIFRPDCPDGGSRGRLQLFAGDLLEGDLFEGDRFEGDLFEGDLLQITLPRCPDSDRAR